MYLCKVVTACQRQGAGTVEKTHHTSFPPGAYIKILKGSTLAKKYHCLIYSTGKDGTPKIRYRAATTTSFSCMSSCRLFVESVCVFLVQIAIVTIRIIVPVSIVLHAAIIWAPTQSAWAVSQVLLQVWHSQRNIRVTTLLLG